MRRMRSWVAVAVAAAMLAPGSALAAPPPNDDRAAAQLIPSVPATVTGTTVEATRAPDDPPNCASFADTVWYRFDATAARELLLTLDAGGDLDAGVAVYERRRSQLATVACAITGARGDATLDFDVRAGGRYLIAVGSRPGSEDASFRLSLAAIDPPARPPGRALPRGGAAGSVNRLTNPDDAWAMTMRAGRTYRLNLHSRGSQCAFVEVYPPGTDGFSGAEPIRRMGCDAHMLLAPAAGEGGRHTLRVLAPRGSRDRRRYRIQAGLARRDDTAPGLVLRNDRRVSGAMRGDRLDALDLYRFRISRVSDVEFTLATGRNLNLQLLGEGGGRIACGCDGVAGAESIEVRLRPGRYFLAVRAVDGARGRYRLSRLARAITNSRTLVDGRGSVAVEPGVSVRLQLEVRPAVGGPAAMLVERFDPLAGWLFHSAHRATVVSGLATVPFRPPAPGAWRVTAAYEGTRTEGASHGGTARFTVRDPAAAD